VTFSKLLTVPDLTFKISSAGYRPSEKSFLIWEGVSMYLPEAAVRKTLRTIAKHSAPASTLVMDFAGRAMIDILEEFPNLPQHKYTTHWGEPWIFGLPDKQEREFFRECGLELCNVCSFFEAVAINRYLTRSDGTKLGPCEVASQKRMPFRRWPG
jgi:O-methyltransferase involved in polyketide biosynthesis